MGTSTSYDAPSSWSNIKADVTRLANSGPLSDVGAARILQNYIEHNGGPGMMAGSIPQKGSGRIGGGGRAARALAGRLAGFLSDVRAVGLEEALRRSGLSDLVGRPIHEILAGILDSVGGPSSSIDDADARSALSRLQEMMLAEATSVEDIERILRERAASLDEVLRDFFGMYLYEQFCRVFFERLVQRVGEETANSFLGQIERFISSTLAHMTFDRDLADIDWSGSEGQTLMTSILETTLRVFSA